MIRLKFYDFVKQLRRPPLRENDSLESLPIFTVSVTINKGIKDGTRSCKRKNNVFPVSHKTRKEKGKHWGPQQSKDYSSYKNGFHDLFFHSVASGVASDIVISSFDGREYCRVTHQHYYVHRNAYVVKESPRGKVSL